MTIWPIIIATLWVSYKGFNSQSFFQRYMFQVDAILVKREYIRLISSGFLHASWGHLFFNMLALYLFGELMANFLGPINFLLLYFASLIGALTQSMVDGVIVMPYSQLWLSIVVGWLMGIHEWPVTRQPFGLWRRQLWVTVMVLAIGFLGYVAIRDFPNLEARKEQFGRDFGGNYQPRFWQQGVIATRPQ